MGGELEAACTLTSLDQGRALRLPKLSLTVTLPTRRAPTAPLDLRPLVVGAGADCDLVLSDPRVSRRHCELRMNGTLVRDTWIHEAFLPPGVPAVVGGSQLVVGPAGPAAVLPLSAADAFGEAVGRSAMGVSRQLVHRLLHRYGLGAR